MDPLRNPSQGSLDCLGAVTFLPKFKMQLLKDSSAKENESQIWWSNNNSLRVSTLMGCSYRQGVISGTGMQACLGSILQLLKIKLIAAGGEICGHTLAFESQGRNVICS